MCVIRRMDAVLEPTKQAVLDTKKKLDDAGITEPKAALFSMACQGSKARMYFEFSVRPLSGLRQPDQWLKACLFLNLSSLIN